MLRNMVKTPKGEKLDKERDRKREKIEIKLKKRPAVFFFGPSVDTVLWHHYQIRNSGTNNSHVTLLPHTRIYMGYRMQR